MRVILVTLSDMLPVVLSEYLNPELEYRAIIVDEPEIARNFIKKIGGTETVIQPFYKLKYCIENFYYDFLICFSDERFAEHIAEELNYCGLPKNKFVHLFYHANTVNDPFLVERNLRYFKEYAAEFDMFATGISLTAAGLDTNQFKNHKLFNFGRASEDLYYNFQIAKVAISSGGQNLKYALIGLMPYTFHYDQSKRYDTWRMLQYFIALRDVHNFWLPAEEYQKLFRKDALSFKLNFDNLDVNNAYLEKIPLHFIDFKVRLEARKEFDKWKRKSYPETKAENVKILDDYLTLCEKNNIRPIMFLLPMAEDFMKNFSNQKLEEFYILVQEALHKHSSAVFLDGWKLPNFTDRDFYDLIHMNLNGAAKFSKIFNDFIDNL